ncbi:hypothetical protein H8356DRAFT_1325808 [Neocallimastix lanati (nom. inval.)]|nr:hypothetical protein H8356DRAFT_1325808 [Neocallimastix sp. JGI-2020a]
MEKNQEIEISKIYRGKEQIILNRKYKFNLSSKGKNQILEYDDSHNHLENKIEDDISNSSILFNVNIKRKYDEISQGMVTRSRRKQLPPDISTFDEILNESKYYKTKRDENFMIFKNIDLIIFQSPFQNGTFYIAPIFSYKVFVTRTYVTELNSISNAAEKIFINANIKYYIWGKYLPVTTIFCKSQCEENLEKNQLEKLILT